MCVLCEVCMKQCVLSVSQAVLGPPIVSISALCEVRIKLCVCSVSQAVLGPLIAIALKISDIHERTGRRSPTVIT